MINVVAMSYSTQYDQHRSNHSTQYDACGIIISVVAISHYTLYDVCGMISVVAISYSTQYYSYVYIND